AYFRVFFKCKSVIPAEFSSPKDFSEYFMKILNILQIFLAQTTIPQHAISRQNRLIPNKQRQMPQ
ncbi:MAG: hypothetical protein ACI4Q4_06980, partial [Oscillospiraceae bacterium]